MKQLILATFFIVGMSIVVNAQKTEDFKLFSVATMNLVNANQKQIDMFKTMQAETTKKMKSISDDKSLSEPEKKQKRQEVYKEKFQTYFNEILTPEQAKKVRKLNKEAAAKNK